MKSGVCVERLSRLQPHDHVADDALALSPLKGYENRFNGDGELRQLLGIDRELVAARPHSQEEERVVGKRGRAEHLTSCLVPEDEFCPRLNT